MQRKRVSRLQAVFATAALGLAATQQSYAGERSDFERYGDKMQFALPLGALAIAASKGDSEGIKQLLKGCAITVGGAQVIKKIFNKTPLGRRPNGGNNSFISGHMASAMCGAAFLDQRYGNDYAIPAYALAASVGYSRIDAHKHHFRDVAGSTYLAYVVSKSVAGADARTPGFLDVTTRPFESEFLKLNEPVYGEDTSLTMDVSLFAEKDRDGKGQNLGIYIGFSKRF